MTQPQLETLGERMAKEILKAIPRYRPKLSVAICIDPDSGLPEQGCVTTTKIGPSHFLADVDMKFSSKVLAMHEVAHAIRAIRPECAMKWYRSQPLVRRRKVRFMAACDMRKFGLKEFLKYYPTIQERKEEFIVDGIAHLWLYEQK